MENETIYFSDLEEKIMIGVKKRLDGMGKFIILGDFFIIPSNDHHHKYMPSQATLFIVAIEPESGASHFFHLNTLLKG